MGSTIVETRYGKVQGIQDGNITAWKGMRYARPPVGELRFRPPQPPQPWDDVYDASEFGPVAPQMRLPMFETETVEMSEDCLSLNVWSPEADDKGRPVLVFIHGGSFRRGSSRQQLYDGKSFAQQGDLVVVTINYRLGPLGFLYVGDIGGSSYESSGNCGLLDQLAALRWVQDNIAAFGGDPCRVTVVGESAGALCISALLCMPEAQGLFHRAVLQSGVMLGFPLEMFDQTSAKQWTRKVMEAVGVEEGGLASLQQIPAEVLVARTEQIAQWKPMVDGVTIPYSLADTMQRGELMNIPMMVGCNLNEMAYFLFDSQWSTLDDGARREKLQLFTGRILPEVEQHYLHGKTGSDYQAGLLKLGTYQWFAGPVVQLADHLAGHSPIWVYRFDWGTGPYRAAHAWELPFVFNSNSSLLPVEGEAETKETLTDIMHQTWIAFTRSGNPNHDKLPNWPEYHLDQRATMIFDTNTHVEADPYRAERRAWASVYGSLRT